MRATMYKQITMNISFFLCCEVPSDRTWPYEAQAVIENVENKAVLAQAGHHSSESNLFHLCVSKK